MLTNLNQVETGGGLVSIDGDRVILRLDNASSSHYSDAQVDDTRGLPRRRYCWDPPLLLSLRARFSHDSDQLSGTAGFGFWNVPFGPDQSRLPALPQAIWFFYGSPPHNVPLAQDASGSGWKASCLDAGRPAALLWAPLAPLAILAMQSDWIRRRLWPRIQRALGASETEIPIDMRHWHHYELEWESNASTFRVDGRTLLRAPSSPRGPLGFVAWIDNQYAIATPRGRFGWGLLDVDQSQWLEIVDLAIT